MPNENGRISLSTILNGVATASVLAIAAFVWGMKEDVSDMKTELALLKHQITELVKRDIPSRSEVKSMVRSAPFPWPEERDDWIAWRAKVNAFMERNK